MLQRLTTAAVFLARLLARLMARVILSRDALHTYVACGSLYGIWSGLSEIHRPTAMIVISSMLLAGVVYARTRSAAQ